MSTLAPRHDPEFHKKLGAYYLFNSPRGPLQFFNALDEPFLKYLSKKFSDAEQQAKLQKTGDQFSAEKFQSRFNYSAGPSDPSVIAEIKENFTSASTMLEGPWAVQLRLRALGAAMGYFQDGTSYFYEATIIVVPSGELNGFVILSPQQRPVVVLNSFIQSLSLLYSVVYAGSGYAHRVGELLNWRHSSQAFAESLASLALYATTGKSEFMSNFPVGPDLPIDIPFSARCADIAQIFIILHEYAHIANQDLNTAESETVKVLGIDQDVVSKSNEQEFKADFDAVYALARPDNPIMEGKSYTDLATALAILFHFQNLCLHVKCNLLWYPFAGTHPTGNERIGVMFSALQEAQIKVDDGHALSFIQWFKGAFAVVDRMIEERKERMKQRGR